MRPFSLHAIQQMKPVLSLYTGYLYNLGHIVLHCYMYVFASGGICLVAALEILFRGGHYKVLIKRELE